MPFVTLGVDVSVLIALRMWLPSYHPCRVAAASSAEADDAIYENDETPPKVAPYAG